MPRCRHVVMRRCADDVYSRAGGDVEDAGDSEGMVSVALVDEAEPGEWAAKSWTRDKAGPGKLAAPWKRPESTCASCRLTSASTVAPRST
jgi:hypothetical protein